MFSKETLEHIGNSAIAATGAVQNHLPENVVAVPCGIVTEDVQHLTPFRRRFTGKLLTGDIGDFITYVKDNASDAEKPQGFIDGDNVFDDIAAEVRKALLSALEEGAEDTHQLQQLMRRRIGRWVNQRYRRRPMILPVVVAT